MVLVQISLFVMLVSNPVFAVGKKHCDIPTAGTSSSQPVDQESCLKLCQQTKDCRAWVFRSGRKGRCFLKTNGDKQFALKFYSGLVKREKKPEVVQEGYDFDNRGKDLRKKSPVATKEKCRQICLDAKDCFGFTYLEGYQDCWLKAEGSLFEKIFYCGTVSP